VSETSVYKIQTPGNYPEENIQNLEQGESLKSSKHKFGLKKLKYSIFRISYFSFNQTITQTRYLFNFKKFLNQTKPNYIFSRFFCSAKSSIYLLRIEIQNQSESCMLYQTPYF